MHDIIIRYIKVGSTVLMLVATLGVVLYKVATATIDVQAVSLETTDVLSILLAIFSVALSVMFYFKSSEDSGKFYSNSYQFTKEMSELLGRIEVGFGERLRHIDEGYSTLGRRIDDAIIQKGITKEKLIEEEVEADTAASERDDLIASLLERTNISEEEKEKFRRDLLEKEQELAYAKHQIALYSRQLSELEQALPRRPHSDEDADASLKIVSEVVGQRHLLRAPSGWLSRRFKENQNKIPSEVINDLKVRGIIDVNNDITSSGRSLMRQWAEQHSPSI